MGKRKLFGAIVSIKEVNFKLCDLLVEYVLKEVTKNSSILFIQKLLLGHYFCVLILCIGYL